MKIPELTSKTLDIIVALNKMSSWVKTACLGALGQGLTNTLPKDSVILRAAKPVQVYLEEQNLHSIDDN